MKRFYAMGAVNLACAIMLLYLSGQVSAWTQHAPTCEEDIRAAILLRDRNFNRSARWSSALKSWFGAGESCLECADDPCGHHGYHGNWEGLECRGDWLREDGYTRWSGQKSAKGPCKKITNFHLPDRGLEGPFPEELKYFPNLHEIDIDSNNMVGTLPVWIACKQKLIEVDIEENQFTGTIPREWGNLPWMEELEVDDNPGIHGCIAQGLPANEHGGRVSFSTDPKIGTSWGGTHVNGKRCPNAPLPDCEALTALPADAPYPRKANVTIPTGASRGLNLGDAKDVQEYVRLMLLKESAKQLKPSSEVEPAKEINPAYHP